MAYEENVQKVSINANADLSSYQYRFVTINASGLLALVGAGLAADGVLQDKPAAANRPGSIGILGITKIEAGAVITMGDNLTPDSVGRAVTATSGDVVGAKALEAASGAGVYIAALLKLQAEPIS